MLFAGRRPRSFRWSRKTAAPLSDTFCSLPRRATGILTFRSWGSGQWPSSRPANDRGSAQRWSAMASKRASVSAQAPSWSSATRRTIRGLGSRPHRGSDSAVNTMCPMTCSWPRNSIRVRSKALLGLSGTIRHSTPCRPTTAVGLSDTDLLRGCRRSTNASVNARMFAALTRWRRFAFE
jgi:hypothetical protein